MGNIPFPSKSFFITLGSLALCGIIGIAYFIYKLSLWIVNHVHIS